MEHTMPDDELMFLPEVAKRLRMPESTLRKMRMRGEGPPGTKMGRFVKFRHGDVEAWLAARFEPPVAMPSSVPPTGALAAARYFPWADITEAIALTVFDECEDHDRDAVSAAVRAAMEAGYEAYMLGLNRIPHVNAEANAMIALRDALDEHLGRRDVPHVEAG